MIKTVNRKIQGAQRTPSRINIKKTMPGHRIIRLLNVAGKKELVIWKGTRYIPENKRDRDGRHLVRNAEDRRQGSNVFNMIRPTY